LVLFGSRSVAFRWLFTDALMECNANCRYRVHKYQPRRGEINKGESANLGSLSIGVYISGCLPKVVE
jgi:hypothetical protein